MINIATHLLTLLHRDHVPFNLESLVTECAAFLKKYLQLDHDNRERIRILFTSEHGEKLLRCAQELAVKAVRESNPDDVKLGLLAVVLEGIQSDYRNSVVTMCLLHHSATKLGVDPAPIFRQAAPYGSEETRAFMLEYLQRGSKSIREMGMEEDYGPEGFDYIVTGTY